MPIIQLLLGLLVSLVASADLVLEVTANPSSVVVGQRVTLQAHLQNTGPKAVTGDFCLEHDCGLLSFEIMGPKGSIPYMSKSRILGRSHERVRVDETLDVGETIQTSTCLLYDERESDLALPEAGDYQVRGRFAGPSGDVVAKDVAIHVSEPKGDAAKAWEYVRKNDLEPYLCDEAVYYATTDKQRTDLLAFVKDHPKTPYVEGAKEALTALGVHARLEIWPEILHFGIAPLGGSVSRTARIHNGGEEPLDVTAIEDLELPFALLEKPSLPKRLETNASLELVLTFAPTSDQTFLGALVIHSSAGTRSADLKGEGSLEPAIELSSLLLDFGSVVPGQKAVQSLEITNNGVEDLVISKLSPLRDPFIWVSLAPLPWTLAQGESKTLEIQFTAERGVFDGMLAITSNDAWSPEARIRLHAVGVAEDGCGCRLAAQRADDTSPLWILLGLAGLLLKRRYFSLFK